MDEKASHCRGWHRLLIFTDASCGDEVVGLGYVIRIDGEQYSGSTYLEGDYTSMEAEYLALKEAVTAVGWLRQSDNHLQFYTDCDPLVGKLEQKNGCKEWNKRYEEFHELAADYDWHLSWIPRKSNREADELAAMGLRKGRSAAAQ